MATVNKVQLINLLKILNLDLTEFTDLSFNGICEEKSLQYFLSWLCNSFDADNVLSENEIADYHSLYNTNFDDERRIPDNFNEDYDDLFDDIQTALETKLDMDKATLVKYTLVDEELHKKEKEILAKLTKTQKNLTDIVGQDKKESVEAEIENTLKICLSVQPYCPNLESYNAISERLNTALGSLYGSSVEYAETRLMKEENPPLENLETVLFKAEFDEALAILRLRSTKTWLESTPTDFYDLMEEEVCRLKLQNECSRIIECKLKAREEYDLQRKLCSYSYLQLALRLNRDVLVDSLIFSTIGQAFVEDRLNKTEKLSNLILSFIRKVTDEGYYLEDLISKATAGSENVIETSLTDDGCSKSQCLKTECIVGAYKQLLQSLKIQFNLDHQFRTRLGCVMSYLRCGPTLHITFIPMDFMVKINKCQELREKITKDLRLLAGSLYELKTGVLSKPERGQQLLWVYFLVDPTKLNSIHRSYSSSFNLTMK